MILALIDRRLAPGPSAAAALTAPWTLLTQLAAGLGTEGWRIDLVLVDVDEMAALNRAYRAVAEPTDVLSFSYLSATGPGEAAPGVCCGERGARRDLWLDGPGDDTDPAPLAGEVVLAPAFISNRCRERGWALDQEMALLVVHGCLHILGWEHDDGADRRAMMDLETTVLRGCGLPHPLAEGA